MNIGSALVMILHSRVTVYLIKAWGGFAVREATSWKEAQVSSLQEVWADSICPHRQDKTGRVFKRKLNKMRPRSERGILVGHAMGASAYLIHLPRLNKTVTSSAVTFDDIPTEEPFLTGRPDPWISPA